MILKIKPNGTDGYSVSVRELDENELEPKWVHVMDIRKTEEIRVLMSVIDSLRGGQNEKNINN